MNHHEASSEALRKLRQWTAEGKLNQIQSTRLQAALERRLKTLHIRQTA